MIAWLAGQFDGLRALDAITVRAALAGMAGCGAWLLFGRRFVNRLAAGGVGEKTLETDAELLRDRDDVAAKSGTPTMGGLLIIGATVAATLLFGDLANPWVRMGMGLLVVLAFAGALDDRSKLAGGGGLSRGAKWAWTMAAGGAAAGLVVWLGPAFEAPETRQIVFPFVRGLTWDGAAWGVAGLVLVAGFGALVIVACANAVNIVDGMDGLAGGLALMATAGMTLNTYLCGHAKLADYLGIVHVSHSGELTVMGAALAGSLLGFLWFNCHPAEVFMGDVGSLPAGGFLGYMAVVTRLELLLPVIGAVFVYMTLSSLVQTATFKATGKRVLPIAPLHHAWQLRGYAEQQIVVRLWILGAVCSVASLAMLKVDG